MDIRLIDNTAPAQRAADDAAISRETTTNSAGSVSKLWSRSSIRGGLKKRKYAKWQPGRLGVAENSTESGPASEEERILIRPGTANTNTLTNTSTAQNNNGEQSDPQIPEQNAEQIQRDDTAGSTAGSTQQSKPQPKISGLKPGTELDILYENQRGWFFFGIPLYSDRSLLNLDPAPWLNTAGKRSFANITNAQVPDPSWEWAWRTWYVDMSGDVDEQGWSYAFSFASSSWHGTHPFWHSFVRRRRWVRLRVKRASERDKQRTELEMAHRLNEDYFTIHSAAKTKRTSASEGPSRTASMTLPRTAADTEAEEESEEIKDIPSLMRALKAAIVDREKLDAVKMFVENGGDELYYLDGKIPDIMARFVYQTSRWQLLTYLNDTIYDLSRREKDQEQNFGTTKQETQSTRRRREHLSRAAETAKHHLLGPDVLHGRDQDYIRELNPELLDLTPGTRRDSLLSRFSGRVAFKPMDNGGEIKGIPQQAQIGHDLAAGPGTVLDEPLLFLYPRWFTSSSGPQRNSVKTNAPRRTIRISPHSSERLSARSTARPQPRKQSFGASSRKRWMSTGSTPLLSREDTDNWREHPTQHEASATTNTTTASTGAVEELEASPLGEGGLFTTFAGLGSADSKLERFPELDHVAGTVSSRDAMRRNRRGMPVRLTPRESRKVLRRKFYMKNMTPDQRFSLTRGIRRLLEDAERPTKSGEARKASTFRISRREQQRRVLIKKSPADRTILVPDETIAMVAGVSERFSEAENIWFVRLLNGCRVHVLPADESVGQYRKVILAGSARAMELVETRLKRAQELQECGDPLVPIRKPLVPVFPSLRALERRGIPKPLIRGVWEFKSVSRRPVALNMLGPVSELCSTVREVVEHVEELTRSLPTPQREGPPHPKRVAKALKSVFFDDDKRHLLSTATLNIAISFLLKHSFLNYATAIFTRAEQVATIDTYNLFLKSAARRQNLRFFDRVLRVMSRTGVRPNAFTWLAYIECLISPAAKLDVTKLMEKKGYLQEPNVVRDLLQSTIQELFTEHLENGGSVDEFFDRIVKTAGLNWFPASLTAQMFSVLGRRRDVPAAERLLAICKEHSLPVTSVTLHELIRLFSHDTSTAIYYTLQYLDNSTSKLNEETYERLFLYAFRQRHYNLCRVLWRYACMENAVTYNMRKEVSFFLTQNIGREGASEQENIWRTSAAKVMVGVHLHLPDYPLRRQLLKLIPREFHDSPVSCLLSGPVADGKERKKQREIARALVKHDMEIGAWYRPKYRLAHMLEAAHELDQEWKDVPRPTTWLMQNAIHIPVEFVGHRNM
ncbi:hypothetical protein BJX61DRAFT_541484 [Aspergillus egyptiacus]|nr:hypothetical protein BJX61DRAFT_541484 [Aspergillus egyptiacus]